mmetsp:Transcript_109015/g.170429  ORF Transcript_109015/g.170429 Transcript_109015/m.170429 type:complete len:549 (+) Transcript_109015:87-1733(+)
MPRENDEKTPLHGDEEKSKGPTLLQDPVNWICTLVQTYSWKLLVMVAATNHLLKGFVAGGGDSGLLGAPMEFMFKFYKVDGGRMQVYMAIASCPWALKPLIGLLSDSLPIYGFRKMPYIIVTSSAGLCSALALGAFGYQLTLGVVVACLFVVFLMVATADLLVEAKQSAEVKSSVELGPDFFLFTWLGIVIGMILATICAGPLIQYASPHACYLVAVPFIAISLWPTVMNYIGEQRLQDGETSCARITSNLKRHPEMSSLCIGMGFLLLAITVVTFTVREDAERMQALVGIGGAAFLLSGVALFIRSEIALPMIFWFLLSACPKVDGALFYFYTDSEDIYPGGPHFSAWMYTTGLGLAGMFGVLTGYLSGSILFKTWRYPFILILTVPCRALIRLLLLPVLWRWNIDDMYWVFPIEFLSSMLFSWSWLPKQVMGAHMTPSGNEATMLALSAGTFNLGNIISSFLGCWLLSSFKICADGDSGDATALKNLWRPYLISVLAPVLVLVVLPLCIPNKLQTEVLLTEHPESCTYGALSRRLTTTRVDNDSQP